MICVPLAFFNWFILCFLCVQSHSVAKFIVNIGVRICETVNGVIFIRGMYMWSAYFPSLDLWAYWWMYQSLCHMADVMPDLWLPPQPQDISTASSPVLIPHPIKDMRPYWPEWLDTYQDDIPVNIHPS